MITAERKAELTAKGYWIEDMDKEWGPGWWSGSFRWFKGKGEDADFQDGDVSDSEEDAWKSACYHERNF
jgi:hypothetical protein